MCTGPAQHSQSLISIIEKDHNIIREEAREFMKRIEEKSVEAEPDRKVGEMSDLKQCVLNPHAIALPHSRICTRKDN
jgi:hypothetical protein